MDDYARFTVLDSQGKTAAIANSMNYLTKKGNPFLAYLGFSIFFFLVFVEVIESLSVYWRFHNFVHYFLQ